VGKYPTPEEAKEHYVTGVEDAKDKWVERCREGAEDYEVWFTGFASKIYPLITTLPDKASLPTIRDRLLKRSLPVAEAIHSLSVSYRKAKLRELAEKAKALVPAVKVVS